MFIREQKLHCLLIILFNIAPIVSTDYKTSPGCPALCTCVVRTRDGKTSTEEWSKVKCVRQNFEPLIIENLKLNTVEPQITQLELSENGITHLQNSFLRLYGLQKLDLSHNEIEKISEGAFKHLKNLRRLDLSNNNITDLQREIFEPLRLLERLKLNSNSIIRLYKGVFDHLDSLKTLDISENPFYCDCTLTWIPEWSRNSSVKLAQPPKCESPNSSKGKPLRKLKLHCDDETSTYSSTGLELRPKHNQIVFEGDSLNLRCRSLTAGAVGGESREAQVTWSWKNKDPTSYFDKIKIENRSFSDNGFVESQLKIDKLKKSHTGDWYCHLYSDLGNHSTAISVIVLSDDSKYCPQIDTKNNKGIYYWPKTIVGFTVDLPCTVKQPSIVGNKVEPRAVYSCNESGFWENLNTTYCPYVSETTRILEQFSQVNLSIAKASVLDSAIKLRNFTGDGKNLTDAMDIVFISKTIENYLMFVKTEKELGYILVDIVATIMQLPKPLLISAQKEGVACSRLVQSVEVVCKDIPTFHSHKSNLAVEEFEVTGVFSGIRCIWYLNGPGEKNPKRFFHCSTNNKTVLLGNSDRIIEASIQIPSSLFSQLEYQGKATHNVWQLIVSMYENSNLFPGSTDSSEDVFSCIIGSTLVGIEVKNLTDPVYIMLRTPSSSYASTAKPVWWDQTLNNGTGHWTQDGCQSSHYTQGMVVFHCNRFGYFGLLQNTMYLNEYLGRYYSTKSRLYHPSIYTGSFILIVCLLISIITYLISHSCIQMSRRAKHSVVNTWISISLLCFIFSCGIYQTENVKICQSIGITLHYLFLSTLLWMSVTASNMYKRLSKSDNLDSTPEDDLPPGTPIQKPILGLYLVGWGIGLIVCGISGAVNLKEYANQNFCFLESGAALSAVYVPAGILLVFLTLFYSLTLCAIRNNDMNGQLSEGTQGTENVDLELLEVPATMGCMDRRSIQSIVTTDSDDVEDPEHSPIIQLKAHVIVLLLYCFIWGLAALSLTNAFRDSFPYQEDICSVLYCVLSFCLGAFVLYFYCVARSDVRSQWTLLRKIFKGKEIHCCRSRSISDTHGNIQMNASTILPNGTNARQTISALSSSSINSSGVTAKSNSHNSNRVKAVKKLNNCDSREDPVVVRSNATNNVNLVAMHRQMYRSNNSMPTYHEITGPDCVEAFYNPRQSIVARKFFKKQRRNKRNDLGLRRRGDGGGTSEGEMSQTRRTWRPSAESAVFLSSDMENASEKIGSNFFGYGSKVNNTNIHVGPSNRHRKSHSPKNPNILTDSDEENRNKLPIDRLVIGAEEETETSISFKNNERTSYGFSRVDEVSGSEDVGSVGVEISEESESFPKSKNLSPELLSKDGGRDYEARNDISRGNSDYRTVELQCSLEENSSDLNSETNFCGCTMKEDFKCRMTNSLPRCSQDCYCKHKQSSENNRSMTESGPDCDSFNEKIDGLHLQSETSLCDSSESKTDNFTNNLSPQFVRVLDPQFGVVKVPVDKKKASKRLSLPTCFENKNEKETFVDKSDSEKTKKETSV